jgi:hypothetical protein
MNLMLEEEIELPETTEIAFIGNLTPQQWNKLLTNIQYKIDLNNEILPVEIKINHCNLAQISQKLYSDKKL